MSKIFKTLGATSVLAFALVVPTFTFGASSVLIKTDSNFSNPSAYNEDGDKTTTFNKDESVRVTVKPFEDAKSVIITGKTSNLRYKATRESDGFHFTMPDEDVNVDVYNYLVYDLFVCGTQVTELNANTILGNYGIHFDTKDSLLTIDDSLNCAEARVPGINDNRSYLIYAEMDKCNVALWGPSVLENADVAVYMNCKTDSLFISSYVKTRNIKSIFHLEGDSIKILSNADETLRGYGDTLVYLKSKKADIHNDYHLVITGSDSAWSQYGILAEVDTLSFLNINYLGYHPHLTVENASTALRIKGNKLNVENFKSLSFVNAHIAADIEVDTANILNHSFMEFIGDSIGLNLHNTINKLKQPYYADILFSGTHTGLNLVNSSLNTVESESGIKMHGATALAIDKNSSLNEGTPYTIAYYDEKGSFVNSSYDEYDQEINNPDGQIVLVNNVRYNVKVHVDEDGDTTIRDFLVKNDEFWKDSVYEFLKLRNHAKSVAKWPEDLPKVISKNMEFSVPISPTHFIWIEGVEITDFVKDDILGDGTVYFDTETSTLVLNGAHLTKQSNCPTENYLGENRTPLSTICQVSNIKLIGDNIIEGIIGINSPQLTITGNGTLTLKTDSIAIDVLDTILIDEATIDIENNTGTGIFSYEYLQLSSKAKINIKSHGDYAISVPRIEIFSNSNISAESDNIGIEVKYIYMDNASLSISAQLGILDNIFSCDFGKNSSVMNSADGEAFTYSPEGKYLSSKQVAIKVSPLQFLTINGIQVASLNSGDVLGDSTVIFDDDSNTLTLNNAKITGSGIKTNVPDISVVLINNNVINSEDSISAIETLNGLVFKGDGTLTINASNYSILNEGNITINETPTLNLNAALNTTAYMTVNGGMLNVMDTNQCALSAKSLTVSKANVVVHAIDHTAIYADVILNSGSISVDGRMGITRPVQVNGGTLIAKAENWAIDSLSISDSYKATVISSKKSYETPTVMPRDSIAKHKWNDSFVKVGILYEINFLNYDEKTIMEKFYASKGEIPVYSNSTPTWGPSKELVYEFNGWSPEIAPANKDASYVATYKTSPRHYIVKFVNGDGTVLENQIVEYGKSAIAPKDPTREGLVFIGWDRDFSKIESDITVKATYTLPFSSSSQKNSSSSSAKSKSSSSSAKSKSSSSGKKDAIIAMAQVPQFSVTTIGRTVQIADAPKGFSTYIFDMQGSLVTSTIINATNVDIELPHAGSYLVRINNQTKKITVK